MPESPDERYRKFHAGRYTDRPGETEWRLRDSYREERDKAEKDSAKRILKPSTETADKMSFSKRQKPKRKDM